MIAVLSPSKTLLEQNAPVSPTEPLFQKDAQALAARLREHDVGELMQLMQLSEHLALLNYDRMRTFRYAPEFPAAWLYHGDVFRGLAISDFKPDDIAYADEHLRILSGLYGLLRPRDAVRPHRLEMGTRLATKKGTTLYDYWSDRILKALLKDPACDLIVNLASKEYSRVLLSHDVPVPVLEVEFKEMRRGRLTGIPLFSKKARGLMARYMAKTKAKRKEDLLAFHYEGYAFSEQGSGEWHYVFTR